ncbi:MAG: hypothetical protein ACFB12_08620 [Leptolyngbyaceae cyanobacterium]
MVSWIVGAASPFNGWAAFEGAIDGPTGGAIYTFADRPILIGIMIVVAALIFLYFIYASFHISSGRSTPKSPPVLGLLLVAGAASAMTSLYEGVMEREAVRQTARPGQSQVAEPTARKVPLAVFGMTGLVGLTGRQRPRKRRRLRDR